MGDSINDGVATTTVNADELAALELDIALADGANQYFQQLLIECFRHRAQIIFGFVIL